MNSPLTADSHKPRRRWGVYSLRTLLLILTASCIWLGVKVNAARRQAGAVAAILKAGGTVSFDYQMIPAKSGKPDEFDTDQGAQPCTPMWLRKLFGNDFFRTPVVVDLRKINSVVNQAETAQLANLTGLKWLELGVPPDQRDGNWPDKDSDLDFLTNLSDLEVLKLSNIRVNGPRLEYIARLTHLRELELNGTSVTEAAMTQIGKITSLKRLSFFACNPVASGGLERLRGLVNLEELDLTLTNTSDSDLQYLKGLAALKTVRLFDTSISDQASRELQKSLPKALVQWGETIVIP